MSIGRLTPVTTSTRPASRNVMARFDDVPPNMSVSSNTPPPASTRSMARAMALVATATSSCQPMDTAVNRGRSPTIISVALSSSVASIPWVITTTPTATPVDGLGDPVSDISFFPMPHPQLHTARATKRSSQGLGDRHAAVAATGAADRDRQIRFSLGDVLRQEKLHQRLRQDHEAFGRGLTEDMLRDLRVQSCQWAQGGHEVRILQEADIEHKVRVRRDAALEREAHQFHRERRGFRRSADQRQHLAAKIVHRQARGVEDPVGELAD